MLVKSTKEQFGWTTLHLKDVKKNDEEMQGNKTFVDIFQDVSAPSTNTNVLSKLHRLVGHFKNYETSLDKSLR